MRFLEADTRLRADADRIAIRACSADLVVAHANDGRRLIAQQARHINAKAVVALRADRGFANVDGEDRSIRLQSRDTLGHVINSDRRTVFAQGLKAAVGHSNGLNRVFAKQFGHHRAAIVAGGHKAAVCNGYAFDAVIRLSADIKRVAIRALCGDIHRIESEAGDIRTFAVIAPKHEAAGIVAFGRDTGFGQEKRVR